MPAFATPSLVDDLSALSSSPHAAEHLETRPPMPLPSPLGCGTRVVFVGPVAGQLATHFSRAGSNHVLPTGGKCRAHSSGLSVQSFRAEFGGLQRGGVARGRRPRDPWPAPRTSWPRQATPPSSPVSPNWLTCAIRDDDKLLPGLRGRSASWRTATRRPCRLEHQRELVCRAAGSASTRSLCGSGTRPGLRIGTRTARRRNWWDRARGIPSRATGLQLMHPRCGPMAPTKCLPHLQASVVRDDCTRDSPRLTDAPDHHDDDGTHLGRRDARSTCSLRLSAASATEQVRRRPGRRLPVLTQQRRHGFGLTSSRR